jgi:hypothetical protein
VWFWSGWGRQAPDVHRGVALRVRAWSWFSTPMIHRFPCGCGVQGSPIRSTNVQPLSVGRELSIHRQPCDNRSLGQLTLNMHQPLFLTLNVPSVLPWVEPFMGQSFCRFSRCFLCSALPCMKGLQRKSSPQFTLAAFEEAWATKVPVRGCGAHENTKGEATDHAPSTMVDMRQAMADYVRQSVACGITPLLM